jgi:hypothetical protein
MPKPIRRFLTIFLPAFVWAALALSANTALAAPRAFPEFPQKNAWTKITPSVVWCGDETSTVTVEVHIVGRTDVRKAWAVYRDDQGQEPSIESLDDNSPGRLFDDGSHGDAQAGDNVFTRSGIVLPCNTYEGKIQGWSTWLGFLRVELADGTRQGNDYGMQAGHVDPKYKDSFAVRDLGNRLSATAYALFIEDFDHTVMSGYPIADVVCGKGNYQAYRKLYSLFPDDFDFALITPGMPIFHPGRLSENTPYDTLVANSVQHIGLSAYDHTALFGSSGRLKSVVYHSFGTLAIATHEIGHTWGMNLGARLGLTDLSAGYLSGHWNSLTDIGGQMSAYYFDSSGNTGHFHDNGDGTWSFISNWEREPYSPLDLYAMGLIPAEEVPSIHILQSPNLGDLKLITAASYKTISMNQITNAEGGLRVPSSAESQKDFNLAFIVTQDTAYNDAAYAFFSLMSYTLMSKDPPDTRTYFTSFYWATGGRGTLNSRLPVDVPDPTVLPGMEVATATPTSEPIPTVAQNTQIESPEVPSPEAVKLPTQASKDSPICNFPLLVGGLTILPGVWAVSRRKQQ